VGDAVNYVEWRMTKLRVMPRQNFQYHLREGHYDEELAALGIKASDTCGKCGRPVYLQFSEQDGKIFHRSCLAVLRKVNGYRCDCGREATDPEPGNTGRRICRRCLEMDYYKPGCRNYVAPDPKRDEVVVLDPPTVGHGSWLSFLKTHPECA